MQHVDIEAALRRVADRRIEEAMREGKFSNLAGEGKPLDLEPMPADENARLTWWALRILRQNDVVPDEVRWLKALDSIRDKLKSATVEATVRLAVGEYNHLVRKVNALGTNAINRQVAPLSLDAELAALQARLAERS